MIRKIIKIDEDKCTGCGICATACHEGAIAMVDGKAKLIRDDFCDGFGDCLPACPTGAITFEEREAAAYDEEAVKAAMAKKKEEGKMNGAGVRHPHGGCPGSNAKALRRQESPVQQQVQGVAGAPTRLNQWPVQIKLVPVKAPYLDGAHLLIAADCAAYAYGNFHADFIKNRITLIGCPKLDNVDYTDKLTEIIRENDIKSVTIVRMEVPCCGGIESWTKAAIQNSGKFLPWQVVTITTDGRVLED